jgi:hypothetical protein
MSWLLVFVGDIAAAYNVVLARLQVKEPEPEPGSVVDANTKLWFNWSEGPCCNTGEIRKARLLDAEGNVRVSRTVEDWGWHHLKVRVTPSTMIRVAPFCVPRSWMPGWTAPWDTNTAPDTVRFGVAGPVDPRVAGVRFSNGHCYYCGTRCYCTPGGYPSA